VVFGSYEDFFDCLEVRGILASMKLTKSIGFIEQLGELIRPKNDKERREALISSGVVLVILVALYYYLFLS